jgi:hypothetical protein
VTRTPAGIAESETSLTAEVDIGSDDMGGGLPLRLLLFEPSPDFASFCNGEQVGTLAYRAELICVFRRISVPLRVSRRHCARRQTRLNRFKRRSRRLASRLTPI